MFQYPIKSQDGLGWDLKVHLVSTPWMPFHLQKQLGKSCENNKSFPTLEASAGTHKKKKKVGLYEEYLNPTTPRDCSFLVLPHPAAGELGSRSNWENCSACMNNGGICPEGHDLSKEQGFPGGSAPLPTPRASFWPKFGCLAVSWLDPRCAGMAVAPSHGPGLHPRL